MLPDRGPQRHQPPGTVAPGDHCPQCSPKGTILIIAGPNGAGKTTFAREFLLNEANCPTFVNADLIAEGLNPLQPEKEAVAAGRMMLDMIRRYVAGRDAASPLKPR